MTKSLTLWGRRLVALPVALVLGLAAMIGLGSASFAAPEYGNIKDEGGSLTIHKHESQTTTSELASPDGSESISSNPVAGVTFTVFPIVDGNGNLVDLTVPSNWDDLMDMKVTYDGTTATLVDAPSGWTLGEGEDLAETDGDGVTKFTTDTIGAYAVVETDAPAHVVKTAMPFIVTIPFPHEDGWLYDVHAYPKNSVTSITKENVEQAELGLGSDVKFLVTTDIPGLEEGQELSSYVVQDTLDDRLGSPTIESVQVDGEDVNPEYYEIQDDQGQTVDLVFTDAGLRWLEGQGGKQVETVFVGTITSVGSGEIENEAYVYVNQPMENVENKTGGVPSEKVYTYWGDIKIHKIDSSDEEASLEGAVFEVYEADENGNPIGDPISVDGETTFTSDGDGIVHIAGLYIDQSDETPLPNPTRTYVVKEVQAPAGFVTPTGDKALTTVEVTPGVTEVAQGYDAVVKNTQQDVPNLPLTGAAGQLLLILGGIGLLLVATGMVIAKRRKAQAGN